MEPSGLSCSDGKRPDGLTLIPWRPGRSLIWDLTVSCSTVDSYLEASSREAGAAAELAASSKVVTGQVCWTLITGWIRPDCSGVPRFNQQRCSPVFERVGQLVIGGDDRGCSSIFVFVPTDFRCDATFQFGFAARWFYWWRPATVGSLPNKFRNFLW